MADIDLKTWVFPEDEWSKRDGEKWTQQPDDLEHAYKHVTCWDTALDVGGFTGMFTVELAKRFESVFVFEPMPKNIECIAKNINGYGGAVAIIETAIGKGSGKVRLAPNGPGFAKKDSKGEEHVTSSIDSYGVDNVGLIKMDIEGMEVEALEGAVHTIRAWHPVFFIEHKFDKRGIANVMEGHGYKKTWGNQRDSVWVWRT